MREVVLGSKLNSVFVVLDLAAYDLEQIVKHNKKPFSEGEIKCLIKMLFSAVHALHSRFVLHRDIKPANCLITEKGVLKLCDFGKQQHILHLSPRSPRPIVARSRSSLWVASTAVLTERCQRPISSTGAAAGSACVRT